MKRYLMSGVVCLALVALCASPAWAQRRGGGGGGGFGRGGFNIYFLLPMNEQLQKELKVSDEQKDKLKAISQDMWAGGRRGGGGFGGGGQRPTEEERKKRNEEREARNLENRKKIEAVLNAEQLTRLKGIALQVGGVNALVDAAKDLKLNDEQTAQLKTIKEETDKKQGELFRGMRDATDQERADAGKKMEQLRKDANEEALAVLTAEQKTELEKMKGDKFELDRSQMFGGGRRRGGNRGGDGEKKEGEKKEDEKKADEKKS